MSTWLFHWCDFDRKSNITWRGFIHLIYICIRSYDTVAVLIRFSWNSHGWCGSTHGWTLLFLETITIGPIEPKIWPEMCFQNRFFGFKSDGMEVFEKKNLKTVFRTPFTKKKGCINFYHPTPPPPVPSKMVTPQKIIFCLYFGKYCFFRTIC